MKTIAQTKADERRAPQVLEGCCLAVADTASNHPDVFTLYLISRNPGLDNDKTVFPVIGREIDLELCKIIAREVASSPEEYLKAETFTVLSKDRKSLKSRKYTRSLINRCCKTTNK